MTDAHDILTTLAQALAPINEQNAKIEYLYRALLRRDALLRTLLRGNPELRQRTQDAFEYKWSHLSYGRASLDNPEHKEAVAGILIKIIGLPADWFPGRNVLDAGCGDGRFSYGLCRLGARVTSLDLAPSGVAAARAHCRDFVGHSAGVADLLTLAIESAFDLVFSFGVVHHTGDTERAVANLARAVAPGGYLFLMVYRQPRWEVIDDFRHDTEKDRLYQETRALDMETAHARIAETVNPIDVRGWFDAAMPEIDDHFSFAEVAAMVTRAGLCDVTEVDPAARHILLRARRPSCSDRDG